MIRKGIQVIASISFIASCVLMIICLAIAIDDTISAVNTGEFKRLSAFNAVKWVKGYDALTEEEKTERTDKIGMYILKEFWKDEHMDLWRFINGSIVFAFANLLVYHALFYFKIHLRKFFSILVWADCIIALILIAAARIYASTGDYTLTISDMFPIAYSIFRPSFNLILSIIFIAFTHFMKHTHHTRNAILLYFRTHSDDE